VAAAAAKKRASK